MLRLALLLLLLLGVGRVAPAIELRLARSVPGPGFGRALAVLDGNLLTTSHAGAQLLDGSTGDPIRSYVVSSGGDVGAASLAVLAGRVLVGVPGADEGGMDAGAVYVFDGATGAPLGVLRNPAFDPVHPGRIDGFGAALAVVGDSIYVAAPWADTPGAVEAGAVYVFDGAPGHLVRTLTAPVRHADDRFGWSVAEVGDTIAVGAPGDDRVGEDAGAVYLFDRASGAFVDALRSPTEGTRFGGMFLPARFGTSLARVGDLLLVGIPNDAGGGAVQVFEPTRGTVLQRFGNPCSPAGFGTSVFSFAGNAVVGDPFYGQFGRFSLYDGALGGRLLVLRNPSARLGEQFGKTFAARGTMLYVGDPLDQGASDSIGAVYFFLSDSLCGSGQVETGEGCDDGNRENDDGCDANCQPTGCGNGVVTAGERCDDGNLVSGDDCDANCTYSECGNGVVTPGEECDDGNYRDGDGCDHHCRPTGCGNGIVTAGEECDDGNLTAGDRCEPDCRLPATSPPPSGRPPVVTAPACRASPVLCDDRDPCTVDSCEVTGCSHGPIAGLDSVICILDAAAARTPGCTGERVPKTINRRLVAARKVLVRARDMARSPARRKLFRKAAHTLRQAGTIAAFAWREDKVGVDCASEMLRVIGAAKGRFDALRGRRH